MKKVIALCLALVLVLSAASLCFAGNSRCGRCGKYTAGVVDTQKTVTSLGSSQHKIVTSKQIYCSSCHSLYWETTTSTQNHCNLSHYKQWLSPNLLYEYDICGVCGAKINVHTNYIN